MRNLLLIILLFASLLFYFCPENEAKNDQCPKSNFQLENISVANPSILLIYEK